MRQQQFHCTMRIPWPGRKHQRSIAQPGTRIRVRSAFQQQGYLLVIDRCAHEGGRAGGVGGVRLRAAIQQEAHAGKVSVNGSVH